MAQFQVGIGTGVGLEFVEGFAEFQAGIFVSFISYFVVWFLF